MDHLRRSFEWKTNAPFFVPATTATLPFGIEPATLTTCDAGEDVDDVPRREPHVREGRPHELVVHEDVHVFAPAARLVHDPIADPREGGLEPVHERPRVRDLHDDLVLPARVRSERRRDADEDRVPNDLLGRGAGSHIRPPGGHRLGTEKALAAGGRDMDPAPIPRAMDTEEILRLSLSLAGQSEVPADTGIDVPAHGVRRALFGIDVESGDLVMAKQLGYDLVIAHHPTGGSAVLDFPKILVKHADILARHGVPRAAAESAVREMQEDRWPSSHAQNYDYLPSVARLLGIGLMCIHNPCDEIGRRVMDDTLRTNLAPDPKVRDAIGVLETLPEFRAAPTKIVVRMGKADNPLGSWAVHHGAGTNGGFPIARTAFEHGIDTVFYIHVDAGHLRRLHEAFGREGSKTLVVTGHVASDSIGINVLVRALRERGVRVDTFSGIIDV